MRKAARLDWEALAGFLMRYAAPIAAIALLASIVWPLLAESSGALSAITGALK